ncbi:MAG: hypothetical protein ACKO3S_13215, partial [bacterium]
DVIRRYVEKWIGGDEHITVVTSDLEVARHARAMGADISLGDLFLASAFPTRPATADGKGGEDDKPVSLSRKELEEWSELFVRRSSKPASSESKDAEDDDDA